MSRRRRRLGGVRCRGPAVYPHGMNDIAEAVRQLRGTAVNQVPGAARTLVTAGTGVPTSGLVLAADG